VHFADGSKRASLPVRLAKGHAHHPLSEAELRLKFMDCSLATLGETQAALLWHAFIEAPVDSRTLG
jgi:hypothetical protein